MIILMKDDPGGDPIKRLLMRLKILIDIFQGHFLTPENILPDLRYAQTPLIISPFLPLKTDDMRIDKDLPYTRPIGVLIFLILIEVRKDLAAVDHKKTDIPVDLGCRQPHSIARI